VIHYHGTPITPDSAAVAVLAGRHAMVSYAHPQQTALIAEVCQSFTMDNGAFSAWKTGAKVDWCGYYEWVGEWMRHPGFDWALIPDVIDGDERANDELVENWPLGSIGVPVWHMHESLARLERLAHEWPRVCIGSSGEYATVGVVSWWVRMTAALRVVCDREGRPICKLHGLRMLNPEVFSRLPLASADSTNIGQNIGIDQAWRGNYMPPTKEARAQVMRERIEAHNGLTHWRDERALMTQEVLI